MRNFSLFNIFSNEHFQQIEVAGLFGHNELGVFEMALQKDVSARVAKCIKRAFLVKRIALDMTWLL